MGSLLDLAKRLDRVADQIDEAASQVAKNVASAIVGDLVYHTPVDTSQALSNWQVTIGTPAAGRIAPYFPGKSGSTLRASAQEAMNAARVALQAKKPGQTIYITNNLPYIRRLNDGYSQQQPAGFVERSALVGRKVKEKSKLKFKE